MDKPAVETLVAAMMAVMVKGLTVPRDLTKRAP